jgi:hypothetical protein
MIALEAIMIALPTRAIAHARPVETRGMTEAGLTLSYGCCPEIRATSGSLDPSRDAWLMAVAGHTVCGARG